MLSETIFLSPISPVENSSPSMSSAAGNISLFNFNQKASKGWLPFEADIFVAGSNAVTNTNIDSILTHNKPFIDLTTERFSQGKSGIYLSDSTIYNSAITTFDILANETLSFNFSTDIIDLNAQGKENSEAYYNQTELTTAFLVLDSTDKSNPILLDSFVYDSLLIPSENLSEIGIEASDGISLTDYDGSTDANNHFSVADGFSLGTYEQQFEEDSQISIIALNLSSNYLFEDAFIGNLGDDVIYGSLDNDFALRGTQGDDKIYASLGDDNVLGLRGNDTIEGGLGDDKLDGSLGNDAINGGKGDDDLSDGGGNDFLLGGSNSDYFIFNGQSFQQDDVDFIGDFQADADAIVVDLGELRGASGSPGEDTLVSSWYEGLIDEERVVDTEYGVRIDWFEGGYLLLLGITTNQLTADTFLPAIPDNLDRLDVPRRSIPIRERRNNLDTIASTVDLDNTTSTLAINSTAQGDNTIADFEGSGLSVAGSVSSINGSILAGVDDDEPTATDPNLLPQIQEGTNGEDDLVGGTGIDIIDGLNGNDDMRGRDGIDVLSGGRGADTISGGNDNDFLFGGTGNDELRGGGGDDAIAGNTGNDTLIGGVDNDTLNGGDGNDDLRGNFGNDELLGEGGGDTLLGGRGNDSLDGGGGIDELRGNDGNDDLRGGNNSDTLFGGTGDDTIDGGNGNDELRGNSGNDSLIGGDGEDMLFGGADDDLLRGGLGDDTLTGNFGFDTFALAVGEGVDTIIDFRIGVDMLGLIELEIPDVSVESFGSSTLIEVTSTGEDLAILLNVAASSITPTDFIVL